MWASPIPALAIISTTLLVNLRHLLMGLTVRPWLSRRGVVVASVPNVGNWAIVADLLAGRFDYIPYSLLSGTHVRHFTRSALRDLFEATGYRLVSVDTVTLPPSPDGALLLARLSGYPGASADLSVAEFVVVARPAGGRP